MNVDLTCRRHDEHGVVDPDMHGDMFEEIVAVSFLYTTDENCVIYTISHTQSHTCNCTRNVMLCYNTIYTNTRKWTMLTTI